MAHDFLFILLDSMSETLVATAAPSLPQPDVAHAESVKRPTYSAVAAAKATDIICKPSGKIRMSLNMSLINSKCEILLTF